MFTLTSRQLYPGVGALEAIAGWLSPRTHRNAVEKKEIEPRILDCLAQWSSTRGPQKIF
jgi:hypothetical protein